MINFVKEASQEAGQKILAVFNQGIISTQKEDGSPLTIADQLSHDVLMTALPKILNIPVLSEECSIPYEERKRWETFWLIDPLDGTKEFSEGERDFCINIALIKNQHPVLGVIYAPALKEMYCAEKGHGFSADGIQSPHRNDKNKVVATSRFHHSPSTQAFIETHKLGPTVTIGAALKFCRLALGEIDIYPRFQGSSEWDTAAGQIIIEEAGGYMIDLTTKAPLLYNKPSIRNNHFIAARSHIPFTPFQLGNL